MIGAVSAIADVAVPGSDRRAMPMGRRHALVVGISSYLQLARLGHAADDAKLFADTLTRHCGFDRKNVHLLTDSKDRETTPTVGNIIGTLEDILADPYITKNDLFVFYFAGHGYGSDKGDFLLPADARTSTLERLGLNVEEILGRLKKANLKNVLFVADACRTTSVRNFGDALRDTASATNIALLLSCRAGQRSYEDPEIGHGIFTKCLTDLLASDEGTDKPTGARWLSEVLPKLEGRMVKQLAASSIGSPQSSDYSVDKARDVLLSLKPPPGADLSHLLARSAEGDRSRRVSNTFYVASWLTLGGDFKGAYKALQSLSELAREDPEVALTLFLAGEGMGAPGLGRSLALEHVDTQNSIHADWIRLRLSRPDVSLPALRESMARVWANGKPEERYYVLAFFLNDPDLQDLIKNLCRQRLAVVGASGREGLTLKGILKLIDRQDDQALQVLLDASRATGAVPGRSQLSDLVLSIGERRPQVLGVRASELVEAFCFDSWTYSRWVEALCSEVPEAALDDLIKLYAPKEASPRRFFEVVATLVQRQKLASLKVLTGSLTSSVRSSWEGEFAKELSERGPFIAYSVIDWDHIPLEERREDGVRNGPDERPDGFRARERESDVGRFPDLQQPALPRCCEDRKGPIRHVHLLEQVLPDGGTRSPRHPGGRNLQTPALGDREHKLPLWNPPDGSLHGRSRERGNRTCG
jgi:hypothetical protein